MRRLIFAFMVVVGLGVVSGGSPVSAVAPSPSFDKSCIVGGDTAVSWKHVRVSEIHVDWYDAANNLRAQAIAYPRGIKYKQATPSTVDVGGRIEVEVLFAGGGGARLSPEPCV